MKWEYVFTTGAFTSIDDLQGRLNALGRSSWEAIGVTQPTDSREEITVLLKRRHRPRREVISVRSTVSDSGLETASIPD
jgi:hypothetical protein